VVRNLEKKDMSARLPRRRNVMLLPVTITVITDIVTNKNIWLP
jgi:hypothetical protein